jgi:sugar-specific transcriptional regulator TrmB
MLDVHQASLTTMGLSLTEAQVYLTLLRKAGPLGASAVAAATGMARSSVYPALNRLSDLGLVETEAGYGSGFSAVRPKRALPHLIARETQELADRKRLAGELAEQLEAVAEPAPTTPEAELIQVFRDPRVIAERFERLQAEANQQIDGFVKAPFYTKDENPAQAAALRRGVGYRCLYERAVVSDSVVRPYIDKWIRQGQQARVYDGTLPHKLAIFDRKNILMPLLTADGQGRTLLIRHPQLASSLTMFFESLWEQATPLTVLHAKGTKNRRSRRATTEHAASPDGGLLRKRRNGVTNHG